MRFYPPLATDFTTKIADRPRSGQSRTTSLQEAHATKNLKEAVAIRATAMTRTAVTVPRTSARQRFSCQSAFKICTPNNNLARLVIRSTAARLRLSGDPEARSGNGKDRLQGLRESAPGLPGPCFGPLSGRNAPSKTYPDP